MNNNADDKPGQTASKGSQAYRQPAQEVLNKQEVEPGQGLNDRIAAERLAEVGPNRLRKVKKKPLWRILADQFTSPVVILLLIAAVLAAAFAQILEAMVISAALVINAGIGFFTEWRARESMESLRRLGQLQARVRRGGEVTEVPAEELVPGDIVLLEEGEMVPADLRLIEVENLQTNEAALTGESMPVAKDTEAVGDVPLAERSSMVYSGTAVTRGTANGVVVGTGMDTEMGRISELVEEAQAAETPLERRLEHLAKRLVYLVIAVGFVVALAGIFAGKELLIMIETAIVLAIAAVPEGLPIVATVALGRGMWRLARRNALVKNLSAVETLGATTVIFSDKTGTLTENRMVLRQIALASEDFDLTRDEDQLSFRRDGETVEPGELDELMEVLRIGMLCTNAVQEDSQIEGDPTEVALFEAGLAAGLDPEELRREYPEQREESFDTDTKKMATWHKSGEKLDVLVKGAPEAVFEVCSGVKNGNGEVVELDEAGRKHWRERNESLAVDGLRVLAVAEKAVADVDAPPYEDLTLLGLVGLYDPPRQTVKDALGKCREAGIRVIMVTGDQAPTAANIAHAVGITDEKQPEVLSGPDLAEGQEDEAADNSALGVSVFSRVAPEQKLQLVEAFQKDGEVVAMTGDGVNDSPALKKADIGIAMGRRGTEVAKETSDIVLIDDAFESIVAAVEMGRVIFTNIRKFVVYLLSGNLGQIVAVSAAALVNAPLPLLPLQILFLNLLLDVFPALALGVGPGSGAVMKRPPRDPQEPILTRGHWWAIAGFGLLLAIALLAVFVYALQILQLGTERAVTMAFLTYGLARLWHTFNMRSADTGIIFNDISRNPYVWGAIGLCALLLIGAIYTPFLADILDLVVPTSGQWLIVLVASLIPLIFGQAILGVLTRRRAARG